MLIIMYIIWMILAKVTDGLQITFFIRNLQTPCRMRLVTDVTDVTDV